MMTPEAWGAFLEGQDLLLQSGELEHPQRVVFQQETSEGVPAATDAHHHMFAMKHLRTQSRRRADVKIHSFSVWTVQHQQVLQ